MYTIEVGVKTTANQTEPEPIGTFVSSGEGVQIVFDASTRASRRVRSEASDVFELAAALDLQTPTMVPNQFGKKGVRLDAASQRMSWDLNVQVYGTFFKNTPSGGGFASTSCPKCGVEYTSIWNKMNEMFGIQTNGFWKDGVCPDGARCEIDRYVLVPINLRTANLWSYLMYSIFDCQYRLIKYRIYVQISR